MSKNISFDALARDVAMEINLGGFRLDKEDLAAVLEGMSRKDIETIRQRVLYYSKDFFGLPFDCDNHERLAEFSAFAERESIEWFSSVKSQEDLGLDQPRGAIGDEEFFEDRGKYFLFSSGSIRRCTKATRFEEWGIEGQKYVMEVPENKVPQALASLLLCNAGENRMRGRDVDFITNFSLPDGRVEKLRDVDGNGELVFVLEGGKSIPFMDVVIDFTDLVIPVLQDELGEQRCRLYNQKIESENRRELLLRKANLLINSFGQRVVDDFMWDQVELHPKKLAAGEKMYLRRSVDDLSDKKSFYVRVVKPSGGSAVTHIDSLSPSEASSVIDAMDCEMELRTRRVTLSNGILIENGPKVVVPMMEIPDGTVTVQSVFLSESGELMVSGFPGESKDGKSVSFPMMWLTDKGINAVKAFTDTAVARLLEQYPRPELDVRKGSKKAVKSSHGIE